MSKKRTDRTNLYFTTAIVVTVLLVFLVLTSQGEFDEVGKTIEFNFAILLQDYNTEILEISNYEDVAFTQPLVSRDIGQVIVNPDFVGGAAGRPLPSSSRRDSAREPAFKPGDEEKDDDKYLVPETAADGAKCETDSDCDSHLCVGINTPAGFDNYCMPCGTTNYWGECKTDVCQLMAQKGEVLFCDDGVSGNEGFLSCKFKKCVASQGFGDFAINQPMLSEAELDKYAACVTNQCFDDEVPWSQFTPGTVWDRRPADIKDFENPEVPVFNTDGSLFVKNIDTYDPNNKFWTCDLIPDNCKEDELVEVFCGFKNTEQYGVINSVKYTPDTITCECGCAEGACIAGPCKPDLIIAFKEVSAVSCVNSLVLRVCNQGSADLSQDFSVSVNVNEQLILLPVQEDLDEGECVDVVSDQLNFDQLNLEYKKQYTLAAAVDSPLLIAEMNEDNNEITEQLITPNGYFDGDEFCLCGCSEGSCLECPKFPELQIKKIQGYVNNYMCSSYIKAEFCNVGELSITNKFQVEFSGNGKNIGVDIDPVHLADEEMKVGQCITLDKEVSIGDFNFEYNQQQEVTVTLDTKNEVEELIEDNNIESALISTGQGYFDGQQYCECGCSEGVCIECEIFPDIIVNTISDTVHNDMCVSSLSFEFCNIGEADLTKGFAFIVSANDEDIFVPFDPSEHEELFDEESGEYAVKPNKCVKVTDNKKLAIEKFDINYGETHDVTVDADFGKQVTEENEDNNKLTWPVSTGPGYKDSNGDICTCGCENNLCLECPTYSDLFVKEIYPEVHSSNCLNSYAFRLCNKGEVDLEQGFWIKASVEDKKSEFEFKFADHPELDSVLETCLLEDGSCDDSKCVDVIKPKHKLDFMIFGGQLSETQSVTIELDSKKEIAEEDEENNDLTSDILNADEYYYDVEKTDVCDAFCYDSDNDGGKGDVWNYGELIYKYDGIIYGADYNEPDEQIANQDRCYGENDIHMQERSCMQKIIKYEDTGKFANPYQSDWKNCRDIAIQSCTEQGKTCGGKCEGGECVILDKDWLQCTDYESGGNPFFKGYIEYVNVDGNPDSEGKPTGVPDEIWDSCKTNDFGNPEYVVEVWCKDEALKDTDLISCYDIKKPYEIEFQGKMIEVMRGHVCEDGKCVPTNIDFEDCFDEPGNGIDPYADLGSVLEIKLLGEKVDHYNYCYNWNNKINMPNCAGTKVIWTDYDCTQDGAKCVNTPAGAKCSLPNQEPTCEAFGDTQVDSNGFDYYDQGGIKYSNEYGIKDSKWDECANNDLLIEAYCADNIAKFTPPYSCSSEGKVCKNDACVEFNEDNLECVDNEEIIDNEVKGNVEGKNVFGEEYYFKDLCIDPKEEKFLFDDDGNPVEFMAWSEDDIDEFYIKESGNLLELYCTDNKLSYEIVTCQEKYGENSVCSKGRCVTKDASLKSCKKSPDEPGLIIFTTDIVGDVEHHLWNFCTINGLIVEAVCDGNEAKELPSKACEDGFKCNPNTLKCEEPLNDEFKCEEIGINVKRTDFFEINYVESKCEGQNYAGGVQTITNEYSVPFCENPDEPWIDWVDETCPEGTFCKNSYVNICKWIEICNDDTCTGKWVCDESKEGDIGITCVEGSLDKVSCEVIGESEIKFTNAIGEKDIAWAHCTNGNKIAKNPFCKDASEFTIEDEPYYFEEEICAENEKCNWKSDSCEEFDLDSSSCEYFEAEESYLPYFELNKGWVNQKPIFITNICKPGDDDFEIIACVEYETGEWDIDDIEDVECPVGEGCNPATHACEKPSVESNCEGPQAYFENDLVVKDTVTGKDQFGNEIFYSINWGNSKEVAKKHNSDICLKDLFPEVEADSNRVGIFWCQEKIDDNDNKYYRVAADDLPCPQGTTCTDGACI